MLVQVSPSAVLRWIDQGLLPAFRTPGGHRRIRSPELIDFLRTHQMPIPRELLPDAIKVLVIDDEPTYLSALAALLKKADPRIEVEVADSPIDGLVKVGSYKPDVVLLDGYMPGMDGVEVCKRLQAAEETKHTIILAMSGRPTPELESAFVKAGARFLLPKPLTANLVLHAFASLGLTEAREVPT